MAKFIFLIIFSASVALADDSDFYSLCKVIVDPSLHQSTCSRISKELFKSDQKSPILPMKPGHIGATTFKIDKKISYILFNDPNYMASVAYCYFVYRGWINPKILTPDQLGLHANGFSILNKELDGYNSWLYGSVEGKSCQKMVTKESLVPVTNLLRSLKGYTALIGINPIASVRQTSGNYSKIIEDLVITLNHERIHAFQVTCPRLEDYGVNIWLKTAASEKKKYANLYPYYNWNDSKVAGREYFAFLYEKKPKKVLEFIKGCF